MTTLSKEDIINFCVDVAGLDNDECQELNITQLLDELKQIEYSKNDVIAYTY